MPGQIRSLKRSTSKRKLAIFCSQQSTLRDFWVWTRKSRSGVRIANLDSDSNGWNLPPVDRGGDSPTCRANAWESCGAYPRCRASIASVFSPRAAQGYKSTLYFHQELEIGLMGALGA